MTDGVVQRLRRIQGIGDMQTPIPIFDSAWTRSDWAGTYRTIPTPKFYIPAFALMFLSRILAFAPILTLAMTSKPM